MTLSYQSRFRGFFLSPESHRIGFAVISQNWAGSGKLSSGVTKSRKMTCWGLANSGLRQARIGQAPVSHLPGVTKSWKMTYRTRPVQFRFMISWNWLGPGKSSSLI